MNKVITRGYHHVPLCVCAHMFVHILSLYTHTHTRTCSHCSITSPIQYSGIGSTDCLLRESTVSSISLPHIEGNAGECSICK